MSDARRSEEPRDRLTRLCDAMAEALEAHPEYDQGDQCIIFLDSEVEQRGGMVVHGYDDDTDALAAIFMHLRAIFRANGQDIVFSPAWGITRDK
ncbi:MAG: hypothetical protein ACJ780_10345 [Solirubrobacteraceae bacterium]|jgi:hypothetical protein